MKLTNWTGMLMGATVVTVMALPVKSEATRYVAQATVSAPAAVRVWVDGGDMFPDYGHVTLWLRADRDCYSSLFLVDTAGFIHVLNARDGWLYGGRTYGYRACDLGLDRLDGRGIAYVFAVGSPVPFDYSSYGDGVCGNGFGYRVVGDPFVASREFYMSILPASCRWDYVGVSFTRFYVREWVRYPSYLCSAGPAYHVRLGDTCRDCAGVYAAYRCNAAAPYEAMRPSIRYKTAYATPRHVVRYDPSQRDAYARVAPRQVPGFEPAVARETRRLKAREMARVVLTSREIARAPRFQPGAQPEIVAYRGRGESREVMTSTREKGAHKKVREAE